MKNNDSPAGFWNLSLMLFSEQYRIEYPLNAKELLRKKKAIKRALAKESRTLQKKIAILGGSTTSEIKDTLEIFLMSRGLTPIFYESEYNKYFEDVMFDESRLIEFAPDLIFVHTTNVNIREYPIHGGREPQLLLQDEINKFRSFWDKIEQQFGCPIIQNNFDPPLHRSMGNLESYDAHGSCLFLNQLNLLFAEEAGKRKNLFIHDINWLAAHVGLSTWKDLNLWFGYKYAIGFDAIPTFANSVASIVSAIFGLSKKCLVLDLDNTLWGGVIGDDGLGGIEIGNETAIAEAHRDLQSYVRRLKSRGVILAVASKNDRLIALEGLSHPENILQADDFATIEANWNPKHQNLRKISEDLNIGINSLVFIDDNPAERHIVNSNEPSVYVPNIGSNVADYVSILDATGLFEPVAISAEDRSRVQMYAENNARAKQLATYQNYDEFLRSLHMVAHIHSFNELHLERVGQLTNKTNQFNLTTRRYSTAEIDTFSHSPEWITLQGRLQDTFGDNGIVSVVTGHIHNQELRIDLWLMSCRVLKRNMEHAMLNALVDKARQRGVTTIIGEYFPTEKNGMVADFYRDMGFSMLDSSSERTRWTLSLDLFKPAPCNIEVISDERN